MLLRNTRNRPQNQQNSPIIHVEYYQQILNTKSSLITATCVEQNLQTNSQPKKKHLNYEIIKKFDMFGGDIRNYNCTNREQAIKKAIELIKDDPTKCATICTHYRYITVYFKDLMACEPSDNDNHGICESVILKTQ